MGFKEFLEEKNSSVYRLCRDLELPQSTVNEFGKSKNIDVMKLGMAAAIAAYFNITIDEFYNACK